MGEKFVVTKRQAQGAGLARRRKPRRLARSPERPAAHDQQEAPGEALRGDGLVVGSRIHGAVAPARQHEFLVAAVHHPDDVENGYDHRHAVVGDRPARQAVELLQAMAPSGGIGTTPTPPYRDRMNTNFVTLNVVGKIS